MGDILERLEGRIESAKGKGNDRAVRRLEERYKKFASLPEEDRKTAVGKFISEHGAEALDKVLDVGKSLPVVGPIAQLLDILLPED